MNNLHAKELLKDPRFQQGKKLLLEALRDQKSKINGVRPPDSGKAITYKELVQSFEKMRGNPLFFPYLGSGFGSGLFVELADASIKYDLITGIGVHYFGHCHEEIVGCAIDAAMQNTIMQGNLQQNVDSTYLSKLLLEAAGLDHVFISTSGAMACENALKIILQKKHPAMRFIAFDGAFMGRTLTLSQITDKPQFREHLPATQFIDYIPFFDVEHPEESTNEAYKALKKHLTRHPGEYAAFCIELVQGEKGFYTAPPEFFRKLIELAKEHSLAIYIDEVQTFGRSPKLFAFQYFGFEDLVDVVTIGKLAQIGATFWKKEFSPKPLLLSQTFTANSSSIRAAIFILEYLKKSTFFGDSGKIVKLHEIFTERLKKINKRFPGLCEGPFGVGAMIAFTPFKGVQKEVHHFVQKLFENGIISFIAGSDPTRVRFLLPVGVIEEKDVHPIMDIVEKTFEECLTNSNGRKP